MGEINNISNNSPSDDVNKIVTEDTSSGMYYCFLCGAPLDSNKACTDPDCPLYGIPQG